MQAARTHHDDRVKHEFHAMRLSESLTGLGHPVAYYPRLAEIFGMQESVFLQQLCYWTGKGFDPDGWIYKSVEEILEETGLSYEQQQRVRKCLGSSKSSGVRGRRLRSGLIEPVLEERYDRTQHKMYFRVIFPALDRAFSQSSLFPEGHLGNTQVVPGHYPGGTWVKPSSSISENTTETTQKNRALKEAHKEFVSFFDDMAMKVRGKNPWYDVAGFRNLKLALKVTDESTLERLALFFLADTVFLKYEISLRVFLSEGVMKALEDQGKKDGFVKRMDGYIGRYYPDGAVIYHAPETRAAILNLAKKFKV